MPFDRSLVCDRYFHASQMRLKADVNVVYVYLSIEFLLITRPDGADNGGCDR